MTIAEFHYCPVCGCPFLDRWEVDELLVDEGQEGFWNTVLEKKQIKVVYLFISSFAMMALPSIRFSSFEF